MRFVNLTTHSILLNSGEEFIPSGEVAEVVQSTSDFVDGIATSSTDEVVLPEPEEGVVFIASMIVAQAAAVIGRRCGYS